MSFKYSIEELLSALANAIDGINEICQEHGLEEVRQITDLQEKVRDRRPF